jgi:hypothetical protein
LRYFQARPQGARYLAPLQVFYPQIQGVKYSLTNKVMMWRRSHQEANYQAQYQASIQVPKLFKSKRSDQDESDD